jgi:hypothetical protein
MEQNIQSTVVEEIRLELSSSLGRRKMITELHCTIPNLNFTISLKVSLCSHLKYVSVHLCREMKHMLNK